MRRLFRILALKIQTFVVLVCGIQILISNSVLGKKLKRTESSRYSTEKTVLLPDLLKELEARRVNKRHIRNDFSSTNSSLLGSRNLFRYNSISNETESGELNRTNVHYNTKQYAPRIVLDIAKTVHRKSGKRRALKKVKQVVANLRKRKGFLRVKSQTIREGSRSHKMRNRQSLKLRKVNKSRNKKINKHIVKYKDDSTYDVERGNQNEELDALADYNTPPVRYPAKGYHLVPYARVYPLYRSGLAVYPRNQYYYQDPYEDQYYVDYDNQRKDVIPKPRVLPLAVQGTKKNTFYKEQSDKRMAYSPIVSAVQNLDRSEANLFDSLLATNHESNRITGDIGSELSNFVGSPGELEVYSPTDTPGDLYFEKDQKNDYSPHLTTNKPTESEVDPSDIVDNEEKLLAIVEKVIKKQKNKGKVPSKSSKSESKASSMKDNGSFDIGDTSKVFNTEGGDKMLNTESGDKMLNLASGDKSVDVDGKLQDFLSKQPKFVKKVKPLKFLKSKSKNAAQSSVNKSKAARKSQNKRPEFALSERGQHVIVENVNPEKGKLLLKSLNKLGDKKAQQSDNSHGKGSLKPKQQRLRSEKASVKSLSSRIREGTQSPHVIKEIIDEDRKGGLPEGRNGANLAGNNRHNGFETIPLSIHESYASRYKIDGRDIPVVTEINPSEEGVKEKVKSEDVTTGVRKDESQPEDKAEPENEKVPSDKEDAKEAGASEDKVPADQEKASTDKESPKEPGTSEDKAASEEEKNSTEKETAKETGTSEKSGSSEEEQKGGAKAGGEQANGTASVETIPGKEKENESKNQSESNEKTDESTNAVPGNSNDKAALEDLFIQDLTDTSTKPSVSRPQQIKSATSQKPSGQIPGWRIRDYYLDNSNSSKWDQLRTAWMGKNNSQYVFNNHIHINPQGTVDTPVTMPPIRFVNGMTMPVLPTIGAPTGMLPHGFPMGDDDEDDREEEARLQQQHHQQQIKNSGQSPEPTPSYGLRYPWQWHNRRPSGSRYNNQQLQFHGKPMHPTYRPMVVTTRSPLTGAVAEATTKPASPTPTQGQGYAADNSLGRNNETSVVGTQNPSTQQSGAVEGVSQNEKEKEQNGQNEKAQHEKGQNEKGQGQLGQNPQGQGETAQNDQGQDGKGQSSIGQSDNGQSDQVQSEKGQSEKGQSDQGQSDQGQTEAGKSDGKNESDNKMKGKDQKSSESKDQGEEKVMNAGFALNETQEEKSKEKDEPKSEKETDNKNANGEKGLLSEGTDAGHHDDGGEGSKLISVGQWSDATRNDGVIKESVTYKNTTARRVNKTVKLGEQSGNPVPQGITGTYTKAPVELPILSQPTTKSVQNFLPGVRSPVPASNQMQSGTIDSYPPWSGAYVEHLRKNGWAGSRGQTNTNADTRSGWAAMRDSSEKGSESYQILTEESTKKAPSDEEIGSKREKTGSPDAAARDSFAYESNLLQDEESANAVARAKASDSPINRQAESINEIRHRATSAQKAAQRQIVLTDNTTAEQHGPEGNTTAEQHSQRNYTAKAPGSEQGQKQPLHVHATASPSATATSPMTEEFRHPTPKPLFPLMISSGILTKAKQSSQSSQDTIKVVEIQQSHSSGDRVSNVSSDQRNVYLPMGYESSAQQTTTESTTPRAIGYKTTDWVTAFATTEHSQQRSSKEKPRIATDNGGRLQKPNQEERRLGSELPQHEGNKQLMAPGKSPFVDNQTVIEGNYHTDEAKLRTAQKVTIQVPEKALESAAPPAPVNAATLPNRNTVTTAGYQYQAAYPSVANTAMTYGQQAKFYGVYPGWPATANPVVPGSTMQSTYAMSDSYLTQFGDQMNMEDLSWTDSTEEKEKICKQEKGTNEVVHVLCFGDSLTRGYYNKGKSHHPYTNKLQVLLNKLDTKKCYILENEGKDGELAYEEMPKRLETVLKDGETTKYDWIVILGGTNDIYNKKKSKSVSEEAITQNIISMHEIARSHHSKSVAVTIPEVFCETQDTCQDAKQLRERVNNNIRSYAFRNADRVVLVDLADMLQRANVGRDMAAEFFEGGLHLKPRGYERMAIIIYEGLKRALS